MRRVIRLPSISSWLSTYYHPTYRESNYRRPFYQRLTPLSRFALIMVAVAVLATATALLNQSLTAKNGTTLLADRVPSTPIISLHYYDNFYSGVIITYYETPAPLPTPEMVVVALPPKPTIEPSPTPEIQRAPWAAQLTKEPDGSYMAPKPVIAKAVTDLSGYYTWQRNLALEDYINTRGETLKTYFTSYAFDYLRSLEYYQKYYEMNRAGRFSVEVRQFSSDGLSAKAGVLKRDWVCDIYDLSSGQVVTQGKVYTDTLTLMSVVFDPTGGRWKFSSVDEVIELKQ